VKLPLLDAANIYVRSVYLDKPPPLDARRFSKKLRAKFRKGSEETTSSARLPRGGLEPERWCYAKIAEK
jgi:hypothetical protein